MENIPYVEDGEKIVFNNLIFDGENQVSESATEILITNKRLINKNLEESGGGFGVVYAVDVQVPGRDKKYPFVLKEFHGTGTNIAKEAALTAMRNHRLAQQAGLKVWRTYRISENQESILMSTGNTDGWQIIGDFNKIDLENKSELLNIENFNGFLNDYYQEAAKAAKKKIIISSDVPFFRVLNNKIDFVLGDVDQLTVSEKSEQEILVENIQNMHSRLVVFFENNFGDIEDKNLKEGSAGGAEKYIQLSEHYISENFHQAVTRYKEV